MPQAEEVSLVETKRFDSMKLAPFVRIGSGAHPTIDLESLMGYYSDLPANVWNVSSSSDLVGWEKGRTLYKIRDSSAVQFDLFVWGVGESQ